MQLSESVHARPVKPKCQLIDFARLKGIRPGELREASFMAEPDVLAVYDEKLGKRVVKAGEYIIYAGRSSADECMRVRVTLPELQKCRTGTSDLRTEVKDV